MKNHYIEAAALDDLQMNGYPTLVYTDEIACEVEER